MGRREEGGRPKEEERGAENRVKEKKTGEGEEGRIRERERNRERELSCM